MTRQDGKRAAEAKRDTAPPPGPIDVVDGIPDRQAGSPRWKLVVLAGIFLAWLAFLLYCQLAGSPPK